MIHLKNFSLYEPAEAPHNLSDLEGFEGLKIHYLRDAETKTDWYEVVKLFKPDTWKIFYDKTGFIGYASKDASTVFPEGLSVIEVTEKSLPRGFNYMGGWMISDNGLISPLVNSKEETLKRFEQTRQEKLSHVRNLIDPIQDAVELEQDADLELLKKLKLYRIAVSKATVQSGWPELPQ